jgi:hypothetical protein
MHAGRDREQEAPAQVSERAERAARVQWKVKDARTPKLTRSWDSSGACSGA